MGSILSVIHKPEALRSTLKMKPVTFILGATGTGKSDLAVALAKRFNGEVINSDAMQLYQGLDIVTNKVTAEESQSIPHHLIGILTPHSLSYTIHDYKRQATEIIDRLLSEGKLPVIVGGTNYYADSLMWESLIPKHEPELGASARFVPEDSTVNEQTMSFVIDDSDATSTLKTQNCLDITTLSRDELVELVKKLDTNYLRLHINQVNGPELHKLLMIVDQETAKAIHPKQSRKIVRALEVLKQHGKSQSEFLSSINDKAGKQSFGACLTYANSLVIWLQCDQDILESRLNKRVDKMIERGLIDELASFHSAYNNPLLSQPPDGNHGDYTRGIFQCIGFKEFHPYLTLSKEEQSSSAGQKRLLDGIVAMQTATRRYAKYQNRWVRKQFFEERNPEVVPPVYTFDSTDKNSYEVNVVVPAITLLEEILCGEVPSKSRHVIATKDKSSNKVVHETCDVCGVTCVRQCEWESHISSRRHHKRLASLKKAKIKRDKQYRNLSETLTTHQIQLTQSDKSREGCSDGR